MVIGMREKAWPYYKKFLSWDIEKQNYELTHKPAEFWEKMGQQKALEVFHAASCQVPAYKKFLAENNINPRLIRTIDDYKSIPPINKKNYLRKYPINELCWDGDLTRLNVISVSSGSTGDPFYWPRDIWQEREVDHWYELTYKYLFGTDKKNSLVIIAFAMGMYIAGPFTFASSLRISQKGYPITISTTSNDIKAILKLIKSTGHNFDQVIIGGYPPFIKDLIDCGIQDKIKWEDYHLKLFFGGESFSENWRDFIHDQIKSNATLNSTINMYGSADSAILGIESPVSILYRRNTTKTQELQEHYFSDQRIPSILSYNPLFKYFETDENRSLLFTNSSGIPLIRYEIGDSGGIIPYKQVSTSFTQNENLGQLIRNEQLPSWRLPLVYLFGRSDFTAHIYGANVYPENIKEALENTEIQNLLSGKFIMRTEHNDDMSQHLNIRIELAPKTESTDALAKKIQEVVSQTLRAKNTEYNNAFEANGEKVIPKITLESNGSEDFKINIKHRWVPISGGN